MNSHEVFIHIHQGCFAGTGAIVRLPQYPWSKPDGYGKISQCITTTKHSKAKTVCIFLGIYCNSSWPNDVMGRHKHDQNWFSLYSIHIMIILYQMFQTSLTKRLLSSTCKPHIYIYIYIIVEKSPNSSHMYDHGFMDNTNRQAFKNWLNSQTSDASLTSCRQPFCKFRTIIAIIRACAYEALFVVTLTNTVHLIYIYIYLYIYMYIDPLRGHQQA